MRQSGRAGTGTMARIDDAEHAFAGENEAGAGQAEQMREAGDHKRQPE